MRIRGNGETRTHFAEAERAGGNQSRYVLALALDEPTPELDQFEPRSVTAWINELTAD